MSLNPLVFRRSLLVILLALSGSVSAIGLGELRGTPSLGQGVRLDIDLIGAARGDLDAACFRLVQPRENGDLPWLKKANLSIKRTAQPVLEIRSDIPLRDPIFQLAIQIGCGNEVSRDYVLFASPGDFSPTPQPRVSPDSQEIQPSRAAVRAVVKPREPAPEPVETPARLTPRKPERRQSQQAMPDRLLLPTGADVGEPSLRLSTELLSLRGAELSDAQRDVLRLEFRMLIALNDQATTQMVTAEKLRSMEATLGELQQRTAEFAQRIEKSSEQPADVLAQKAGAPVAMAPAVTVPSPTAKPADGPVRQPLPASPGTSSNGFSEWRFYGLLLGFLLGLAGWFAWKRYRESRDGPGEAEMDSRDPLVEVDPRRSDEFDELGGVDLHVEPAAMGAPMKVDVDLGHVDDHSTAASGRAANVPDSVFSVSAATVDEHFEANPVMELADIMLSFGRVKGAAQALQEYIDHNPQEALQPWIRLMEVYRMAGMREEFEAIARNLNQNFNVEIQKWDAPPAAVSEPTVDVLLDDSAPPPLQAPRPQCLEDMPRIMNMVLEMWPTGDVIGYLYQLLRDNRDGKRIGFALPVVEEILFLIELKETSNRFS